MQKKCRDCQKIKSINNFSKTTSNKDGYATQCKPCKTEYTRKYSRTIAGRATAMRGFQVASSRKRKHPAPAYTKTELLDWLIENNIKDLMGPWKDSNYHKNLAPSVDRLDDNKGYSFDNIRLVTWAENRDKMYTQRKSCERITKQNRKVNQLTLQGKIINTFLSISAASRETDTCRTHINTVCAGKQESANGFKWAYA